MADALPNKKGERYWPAGGKKLPPSLTAVAAAFIAEHSRLLDFVVFVDKGQMEQLGPLRDALLGKKEVDDQKAAADKYSKVLSEVRSFGGLMDELVLAKTVDNFLTYISELLALIYKTKPSMLKSAEQERLDFILQYKTMDELASAIAEKRVERLAYLGLRDLDDYIESQMKFRLFENDEERQMAALIVEYRNLLSHNRGVVSNISARRFPQLAAQVGKRISMTHEELRDLRQFLEHSVVDIDVRAAEKFTLPAAIFPEPPPELLE